MNDHCSRKDGPSHDHTGKYTQGYQGIRWCLKCGIEWILDRDGFHFYRTFPVSIDTDGRYMDNRHKR